MKYIVTLMISLFFILQTVKIQAQEVETIADNLYRSEDLEVDSLNNLFVCGMDVGIAYVGKLDTAGQVVWYSFFDTLLLPTPGGESKSFSFIHLLADGTGGVYAFGRYENRWDKAAVVHLNGNGGLEWIIQDLPCGYNSISMYSDVFWQTEGALFVASYIDYTDTDESTVFYQIGKSSVQIEKTVVDTGLVIRYTTEHPYYDSQWHFQTSTGIVGVNEALEITYTDYGFTNETYPGDWVLKSEDYYLHINHENLPDLGSFEVSKSFLAKSSNGFDMKDSMRILPSFISSLDTSIAVIGYVGAQSVISFANYYGFVVSGGASWVYNDTIHYAVWYGQVNPDNGIVEREYYTEQLNSYVAHKVAVQGGYAYYLESSWYTSRIKKWQLTPIEFETRVISSVEKQTIQHKELKIYPNPTEGDVIIEFNTNEIREVSIFNLTGNLVYRTKTSNSLLEVDLAQYPKGMYLIHVADELQQYSVQKLLVK